MSRRILVVAATLAAGAGLAACAPYQLGDPGDSVGRGQAADAQHQAAQRCKDGALRQRPGSDGTAPGDYICTGH